MHKEISRITLVSETPKIDLKDKKILSILAQDSRTPFSIIAKKVLLSRDAVRYRIERMEKLGVIQAFVPVINYELFDYKKYHIMMQIDSMTKEMHDDFINYLNENNNVVSVIEYSDLWDIEIVVIAKDSLEFDAIISEIKNRFNEGIEEIEIFESIKEYYNIKVPKDIYNLLPQKQKIKSPTEKYKLDELDISLLKLLSEDCRQPSSYYAQKLNVSQDTINYRLEKLFKQDVIKQFTIVTNISMLGYQYYKLFLLIKAFLTSDMNKLRHIVESDERICYASKIIGDWNILFEVMVKQPKELHLLIQNLRKEFRPILKNMDTLIAYVETKHQNFTNFKI